MNFYWLALLISLAVWFLVICGTSLLSSPLRRILFGKNLVTSRWIEQSPAALADAFFVIRTFPLFLAMVLAAGIALPAFLENEPHSTSEPISAKLWLLASAGAVLLLMVTARGVYMLWATARVQKRWQAESRSQLKIAGVGGRMYCVEGESPLLAVTGIFRPKIFVSRQVLNVLSAEELRAAVAHEIEHVRRFDNLKQLVLNIMRPLDWPGSSQTFSWTLASEVAADEGALARGASALDLASALVKVAALKRGPTSGRHIAASHLLPDLPGSPLAARVERLQQVLENHSNSRPIDRARKPWRTILLVAIPVLLYVAAVSATLPAVHEALEFLVR